MQTTQQFIVLRWSGGIAVAPAVCEHALRAVRYLIPSSRESSSNRRSIAIYLFDFFFYLTAPRPRQALRGRTEKLNKYSNEICH